MNKTKICIYGAGSIGAYLAHAFHKSGSDVKLIARGKHLEAIQLKGLTFIKDGLKETIQFDASNDPNDFGKQEPGSSKDIKNFCEAKFGITFPMTEKISVKGEKAHPFYKWAKENYGKSAIPKWNFHKIVIGKD